MSTNQEREKAIDAADILNDLIGDFVIGTGVFKQYDEAYRSGNIDLGKMIAIQKMCISHLILGLSKISEFNRKFGTIIPMQHRGALKVINKNIREKDIEGFRNKIVGHIWDRKKQRPLRKSEIEERLKKIVSPNMGSFLSWINNPNDNSYPSTVLSVIETIRDSIVEEYQLNSDEIIER